MITIRSDAFMRDGQKSPGPVKRIVFVASMPERVVLNATANLVKDPVGELDQMERISNLDRVGKHRVEHRLIGA